VAKVDVNRKVLSLGQEQLQKNLIKRQDHVQKYEGSLESTFKSYSNLPPLLAHGPVPCLCKGEGR